MKLLRRSIASRNAASLMLGLWLFVLASGVANACLLKAPDHAGHQPASGRSHSVDRAAAAAHASEQSSTAAPCLTACDEGSQALQSSNGNDSIDPGAPPPWIGVLWAKRAPLSARHRSGVYAPPSLSDPPERIIYSRWAL